MIEGAPPPITADILAQIKDEEEFGLFVCKEFDYEAAKAGLKPQYSPDLLHDAWQSYLWDVERLDKNMPSFPDHFKHCGYLAYWLRRHSPILVWEPTKSKHEITKEEKSARDLIVSAGRPLHAFSLGYRICKYFEQNKESPTPLPRDIDRDYLQIVLYYMKYKSVSPHAMGLIYRSLFWV